MRGAHPERSGNRQPIDKQHGHICLDIHEYDFDEWEDSVQQRKETYNGDALPERGYEPVPDGQSGNLKLGVNCSYCSRKRACFGSDLRTYLYSTGPRFLVKVEKPPRVPELLANGDVIVPEKKQPKKDEGAW